MIPGSVLDWIFGVLDPLLNLVFPPMCLTPDEIGDKSFSVFKQRSPSQESMVLGITNACLIRRVLGEWRVHVEQGLSLCVLIRKKILSLKYYRNS